MQQKKTNIRMRKSAFNLPANNMKRYFNPKNVICLLLILVGLLLSGCHALSQEDPVLFVPTYQSSATSTPTFSQFHFEQLKEYPKVEIGEITGTEQPPISVKTRRYEGFEGVYQVTIPEDWDSIQEITQPGFIDPDGEAAVFFYFYILDNGLENDSFLRFINAREENIFAEFDSYLEIDRQLENSGQPIITKVFDKDEKTVAVRSGYMRQDSFVFIVDFWSFNGEIYPYKQLFTTILTSVTFQSNLVDTVSKLPEPDNKTISNEFYRVSAPIYWEMRHTHIESSYSTTLVSPDERVIVQVLVIFDDRQVSKTVISELVLEILGEKYTKGLWILSDEILSNGREKLTWSSYQGNYEGLTIYKTFGSVLYVVSGIWDNAEDAATKQETAESIIESFEFLAVEGE